MSIFHFNQDQHQEGGNDFSSYYSQFHKPKHWLRWVVSLGIIVAAAFLLWGAYAFFMEYWQIEEIGKNFTGIFWTNLIARGATWAGGFLILFAVFLVNLFFIKKIAVSKYSSIGFLRKKWPYVIVCFLLALLLSKGISDDLYIKLLQAANGGSFGAADPLFQQDVGYYVFQRPFFIAVTGLLKGLILFQIVISAVIYGIVFFANGMKNLKEIFRNEKGAVVHVVVNILIYFVLMALSYKFVREDMLYSTFGREDGIFGAGYVDAVIWLNYYRIIPFVLLAVIVAAAVFLYKNKLLLTVVSIAVIPAAFTVTTVIAGITQTLIVSPDERNLQRPYIENNMQATCDAYALNQVAEQEFVIGNTLSAADIENNQPVLDNIRIADFKATLTAYNQLQYLRRYFSFNEVDVVPYEINGQLHALFIAAREMNKDNIEESARSYANQVFRYTHGFGAVMSPINKVTSEGQPEFYIKDIPPQSVNGAPEISQPRIYYGELTNDYVIVNPNKKELDYSEGLEDKENSYDGAGGIPLDLLRRVMFAIKETDYRIVFSGNIDGQSKILLNRNIMQRVKRVAPFFRYDADPYLLIDDNGRLKWVVDGYTTTSQYPYSQPVDGINYIRNSVKAMIDAYDGTVNFYITDSNDPIAAAYAKIYPGLFTAGGLPPEVAQHITMPQEMFNKQANIYQRYHVKSPDQFYDKSDVWRIATEKYQDGEQPVQPYFNIMRAEDTGRDELVLVQPYVLGDKYNMVGLLMTRTSPEHYGEMMIYRFPKSTTVYGPMQIENKIDNDPDISREMTLWGQGGSTVIRGNMLVVPFKDALLYVEPIYITSQNNASLPELKRIVVGYKDAIAMDTTLNRALTAALAEAGVSVSKPPEDGGVQPSDGANAGTTVTPTELDGLAQAVQNALDAYSRFKTASGSNDWEAAGKSMAELDQYMAQLEQNKNQ